MAQNQQFDSIELNELYLPYDRSQRELSEKPRLIRGQNSYVTLGGKLVKRPGTLDVDGSSITKRAARLWLYETLESPPKVYILGSFFNTTTSRYEMYWFRPSAAVPVWTLMGTLRNLDTSQLAHEVVVSRGLAFIKGFPDPAGDKLGTVVFDGSGASPTLRFWGLLGPTVPAAISGRVTRLNGTIDAVTTTVNVVANFSPAVTPPFVIQVDYEQMNVTSTGGGTNWTVTRAYNGTVATTHDDDTTVLYRDWSASDHRVDVNFFWEYGYAWETPSGQISNISPVETNPDKMPSRTGPFFDLLPKVNIQGHADTTNVTKINLYRTQDAGGTPFKNRQVTNTGAGTILVLDNQLESGASGGTFNDPIPDDKLDTGDPGPSLTDHSPPPSVNAPLVVGTDTPAASTPIVSYAGRLWYGIGNILYFSGQEETIVGIPEHSWPSGLRGNFYRLAHPITNLVSTDDSLYVMTLQVTYQITGTNLETFNIRPLFDNIGAPYGHVRAVTRFGPTVAWVTHDFRVVLVEQNQYRIISDPLFTDIIDSVNVDNAELELDYWGDLDKEWLVLSAHVNGDTLLSRQWIYDLKLSQKITRAEFGEEQRTREVNFWNTPWSIRSTACLSGRIYELQAQRRLVFFVWNGTSGRLVRIDPTLRTGTDTSATNTADVMTFNAETNLFTVPPGNHVNSLRTPALDPTIYALRMERTLFKGDTDPKVYAYFDDFWSDPMPLPMPEDPPRRDMSKAYKTLQYGIERCAHRVGFKIQKVDTSELFEMQDMAIIFMPESGV